MFKSITKRTATFEVPMDVQELMSVRTATLTFNFLDPVECLIRLLTVGPLSADMGNMAFTPRLNHSWYDGLLHPKCMSVWVCYVCNLCLILCVKVRGFRRRWPVKKSLCSSTTRFIRTNSRLILWLHQSRQKRWHIHIYLFRVFVLILFLNCVLMMIVSMSVLMYVLMCY